MHHGDADYCTKAGDSDLPIVTANHAGVKCLRIISKWCSGAPTSQWTYLTTSFSDFLWRVAVLTFLLIVLASRGSTVGWRPVSGARRWKIVSGWTPGLHMELVIVELVIMTPDITVLAKRVIAVMSRAGERERELESKTSVFIERTRQYNMYLESILIND